MNEQQLVIEVYSAGLTRIADPNGELMTAEGLRFATGYPGGLYLDASFEAPRQAARWWALAGAQRVVVRNGLQIVYEGWIDSLEKQLDAGGQSVLVSCIGGWGRFALARRWRKIWADNRLDEAVWPVLVGAQEDKFNLDRYSRLLAMPKDGISFTNGDGMSWQYTMPAGETVKRVTFDYDLQEAAQAWSLGLYNVDTTGTEWSVAASGSGSADVTLGTAANQVQFFFQAKANQTGIGDGTIYGKVSNLMVYSETGAINLTEVAKDVRAKVSEFNASEALIGSNTLSIAPFVMENWPTIGDILTAAAGYGDSSFNRWAVALAASEQATTPDGKPVLLVEQWPALTDYDYAVRLDEAEGRLALAQDVGGVANWVVVQYDDEAGQTRWISPDDDATLTDATSVASYGRRDGLLSIGYSTQANAVQAGRRYLAAYKDAQWVLSGPVTVRETIRAKAGVRVPVSQVRAGKRLRVDDFVQDLSGSGLTFLITRTDYQDAGRVVAITAGPPPGLLFPAMLRPVVEPAIEVRPRDGGGGGKKKHRQGKWNWNQMTPEERKRWMESRK